MRINADTLTLLLESDLLDNGWDSSLEVYPGQTPHQYAMMSLRRSLLKKYLPGISETSPDGDSKALDLFLEINNRCGTFDYGSRRCSELEEIALGEAKAFLYNFFYPSPKKTEWWCSLDDNLYCSAIPRDFILSNSSISEGFGVGPGASLGSPSTNFYTKLANSSLSMTSSDLYCLFRQAISSDQLWTACEISRKEVMDIEIVQSSRLSFVPKTTEISRTICTEPLLNMIFQKGIGKAIERRLLEFVGINLSTQPGINAELARIGSLSGKFGTIDLSSASDSMSISLVREFFPRRVVALLELASTRSTILPDGREIELHMISSMGNAFTFPLQTLFFTALVYGAYRARGVKFSHSRGRSHGDSFAVFGDDIIVERDCYSTVCQLLNLTGFRVNIDKSFNEGLFRESCGSDFYSGHSVRGVYIRRLFDANDCYSAINRLNRWSAKHWVFLPKLIGFLVGKARFLPIPYDEQDDRGIKVPRAMLTQTVRNSFTGGIKYRSSCLLPERVSLPMKGKRAKSLGWFENPDGLLMAFLAGSIRSGSVGLRTSRRRAKIRESFSSRWDWIPLAGGESYQYRDDWKVITTLNLSKV